MPGAVDKREALGPPSGNVNGQARTGGTKHWLFLHALLTAFVLCVGLGAIYYDIRFESLAYSVSVFFWVLSVWCFGSWYRITRSKFDPYLLMLLAVVLFNGGHLLLKAFYPSEQIILATESPLSGNFSDEVMLHCIVLVFWGVCFMHLGALWAAHKWGPLDGRVRDNPSGNNCAEPPSESRPKDYVQAKVAWLFIIISIVPAVLWEMEGLRVARLGGYNALFDVGRRYGSAMRILQSFFVPGCLFLLAVSRGKRMWLGTAMAGALTYGCIEVFIGKRQIGFPVIAMVLWVFHTKIREIPWWILGGAGAALMFLVLPVVRFMRKTEEMYSEPSFDILSSIVTGIANPARAALSEMGNSMGCIAHILRLVPDTQGFAHGMTYVRGITTIMPNFFWAKHPGAHVLGDWWLYEVSPTAFMGVQRGTGFSIIAEAYYNFGTVGVPIVLFLWGALISAFTAWAMKTRDAAKIAMFASFSLSIFLVARGTIATTVRPLFWYALFPYVVVCLWKSHQRHKGENGE